jgi:putative ABC transport system permease protein
MLMFTGLILAKPDVLEAQYAIPLGGMVLGNCLRADIVGISRFFDGLRQREKPFLLRLSQGATVAEAVRPYVREAFEAALSPTVATIATVGLVSLPGMMTGVVLAGAEPIEAIQYQMVIMLAILSGTALTLWLGLWLMLRVAFTRFGTLDERVLR